MTADLPANYALALEAPTAYCVVTAASRFSLPPEALLAIMFVEGGRPGTQSYNPGSMSWDLGVMQVNDLWLKERSPIRGYVTWRTLRDDLCVNIHSAAWILASELLKRGDMWRAVGAYHAPNDPERAQRYRQRVNKMVPYARQVLQNSHHYIRYMNQFFRAPGSPVTAQASGR